MQQSLTRWLSLSLKFHISRRRTRRETLVSLVAQINQDRGGEPVAADGIRPTVKRKHFLYIVVLGFFFQHVHLDQDSAAPADDLSDGANWGGLSKNNET